MIRTQPSARPYTRIGPRPAEQHVAETLERQVGVVQRDPQHSRAEHGVGGQAERLAHDGSPAVGADDARRVQG